VTPRSTRRPQPLWVQAGAWLGMALVLLLTCAAASPTAHGWLHAHETAPGASDPGAASAPPEADAEHGCAVILFAGGATLPLPAITLPPAPGRRQERIRAGVSAALPPPPRWLLPPESGPPVRSLG
jgi:hypothetical protein